MTESKELLATQLCAVLQTVAPDAGLCAADLAVMFEYPPNPEMGDLAFPCFRLSRTLRKAPPMIAAELAKAWQSVDFSAEQAGGYLNFRVNRATFATQTLDTILSRGKAYGATEQGKGKTVVLDYSSPNVAKPFHVGHLGTTVIGHSLKNLFAFCGYHCIGINHLGDWGTQFGKLIVAFRKWGSTEEVERKGIDELVALYVRFHAEAEKDPALNDEARAEFTKLEHHDEENLRLWKWFIKISLAEYEKTYRQLGITFDSYAGESFYTDKMPEQVEILKEKHLLKLDDGASIVDLSAYNMPPCLILKKDGSTLYPTRDIAAAVYRMRTYHFDRCVYVTAAAQSLHFAQWFKVVELMGYDWYDRLVHVPYGMVSINGAKLATRTGNVVLLKDVFAQAVEKASDIIREKNPDLPNREEVAEAVGVGAIVFHYLSNNRIKDINFVLEDVLTFEGNTGPYAQYTHARTCSILSKATEAEKNAPCASATEEEEFALIKTLSLFPEKVQQALAQYEPSVITRYILDVCTDFNRFYHEHSILGATDAAVRAFRLKLTAATKIVLSNAFPLICLKAPEKI